MGSRIGAKLAQLANAKKLAAEQVSVSPEDQERIAAERRAAHLARLCLLLEPHVSGFNEIADASLWIALETHGSSITIKQDRTPLLSIDLTERAAVIRRKGNNYSSDDYFTIDTVPDGTMTFRRYSAEVEKPLDGNRFAERILMEALGLDQ